MVVFPVVLNHNVARLCRPLFFRIFRVLPSPSPISKALRDRLSFVARKRVVPYKGDSRVFLAVSTTIALLRLFPGASVSRIPGKFQTRSAPLRKLPSVFFPFRFSFSVLSESSTFPVG